MRRMTRITTCLLIINCLTGHIIGQLVNVHETGGSIKWILFMYHIRVCRDSVLTSVNFTVMQFHKEMNWQVVSSNLRTSLGLICFLSHMEAASV